MTIITRHTLEQQRQRYQKLFDFAPDGYLVTDVHGVIQEANYSAASFFWGVSFDKHDIL